ncbi:MAG: fibronectin type III domain-containing protein, partial [Elusimicrobiota bacterium]
TATAFNGAGSISANGSAGATSAYFGGGGGGGRIAVVTGTDASNLNLQANGGAGGGPGATGGGAGVIALKTTGGVNYSLSIGDLTAVPQSGSGVGGAVPEFSTVTLNNSIVNFDPGSNVMINSLVVAGGATLSGHNFSFGSAAPLQVRPGGSLKVTANQVTIPVGSPIDIRGSLTVTANQLTIPSGSPIEVQGGGSLSLAVVTNSGGALIVRNGGVFAQLNAQVLNFDSVLVEQGGVLMHAANGSTRSSLLNLAVSGNFDLQAGATISAVGLGYAGGVGYREPGKGPGGGLSSSFVGGGGAHGGAGGKSSSNDAGGAAYDSATNPLDLGSGGAGSYANGVGGAGGGAVLIAVGGAFSLNGRINVSGEAGTVSGENYGAGGGAGGTVNITATAFNGAGSISANGSAGGTGAYFGGGGGGGIVALTGCNSDLVSSGVNGGAAGGGTATSGGAGVFSPVVPPACPNAPPPPANLAVTSAGEDASGSTFITATWDPAAQALSYVLQASTASNFTGIVFTATSTATAATVRGLTPNATYFLAVKAFNDIGFSNFSTTVSTFTPVDLTAPQAPSLTSAKGKAAGVIVLTWQASASGEVSAFYNVYRATADFSTTAGLAPALTRLSTTSASDVPSVDGIYFYGVTALDPSGNESALSNRLSTASIHAANAPISNLTASFLPTQKQIVLNWSAPSTGTSVSYSIYRATYAAFPAAPQHLLQSLNALILTDHPSLTLDATYFYRVTSLNSVGHESASSNAASSVFDVHAPVITFSGIANGQSTRFDVSPGVAVADFSPVVSTLTLNGQPFVSSTTVTGAFNQTVGEGGTASLSCAAGAILSFTSVWATSCSNPQNCGTCPIGGTSCTVVYSNATCGDVAPGCSKDGRLAITCGYRTTLTEPGAYVLALEAQDAFAHASSATVSFTIDKSSPVIVLTSPVDGSLLNSSVVVTFSVTDDFTPPARMLVTDELGAVVTSPYVISAEGARMLRLTARDLAGNSSSAEVAFILDKTPPLAVADLRVTAADAAVGVATLAWTSPHDGLSGLAGYVLKTATFPITAANFASAQTVLVSTSSLPEGETESFVAQVSGAQTAYFALKSADAAGNLSALSNLAFLDLDGPALSGVSPAPGTVISRLTTFAVQAADLSGVAKVVFSVDGIALSTDTTAPYQFAWNTVAYADGAHALRFDALDGVGTASSLSLSYTLSYQPPPTPVVTAPPANFTTFTATVTVAGTAEPGTTVQVLIDGFVLASALTSSTGSFSTIVTLPAQGSPLLTVLASDSKGSGTPISPIVINYNLTPPGVPGNFSAASLPAGRVRLAWDAPAGKVPSFYRVYRGSDSGAFSPGVVPSAALRIKDSLNARTFDDLPAQDGVYYYAVTALDASLNESGASDSAGAVSDRAVPAASLAFDVAPPFGAGAKRLQLTLSKALASPPLLLFRPLNQAPVNVSLAAASPTVWIGTLTVTSSMNSGVGTFTFQGSDFVGNVGTSLTNATALLDLAGPSGAITLTPASPVKAGSVALSLTLTEAVPAAPHLAYVTAAGSTVPVTLAGGGAAWTGDLAITPGSDGLATFSLSATDALGNAGAALTSGGSFVIKTTAPGEPLFVRAIPQKAGAVRVSWSAPVSGTPASYSLYRDGVRISSGITPLADGSGLFTDHPADGPYAYAAGAVDAAGNESALSTPVAATAKSVPPAAPVGAGATFSAFGHIEVNWQAGSPDSSSYRVHRTSATGGSFASVTFSAVASTAPFIDTPPQNAVYFYFITALDFAGNESAHSTPAQITWDRAPPAITVAGVQEGVLYNRDVAPSFSATGSATAVTLSATLNAGSFVSGSTVSAEGNHLLTVHAVNQSNAGSTVTVHFTIDKTPPSVAITGIPSGTSLVAVLPQVTATDLHLGAVTLTLDGGSYPQGTPISASGAHVFTVTAADLAGNVTVSSRAFTLNLPPSAPLNFKLTATEGAGATFTWGSPAAGVAGYRFYKDGILKSQGLLSGLQFSDAGFALGAAHIYEVLAVDASGQDGARARISVPAVDFTLASYGVNLNGVQALTRGFFDTVQLRIINTGAQAASVGPATVELISTATVASVQAPSVSVPAGGNALMPAVVAVIPDMPDAPTLRATLTLPVGLGGQATVTKTFPLSARTPLGSPVELFAGPMIFGANAAVQVKFNNKGSAPLEIRTAINSDLSVTLATPQGTVLSQALLSQTGNGAQAGPTGYFVSVAPGSSYLFDPVMVFVPEALGSSALLSATIGRTFNNLLGAAIQGTRSFEASQSITGGTAPAYSATITADRAVYDQGSTVILSGEARDTLGALVPGATVQVGVSVRGFVRGLSAKTDAAGHYSLPFDPAPTESGIYTLWAANPSVVSRV